MSDVEGWDAKGGRPLIQKLAPHAWGPSFLAATVWDRSRVVSGSVAVTHELDGAGAITSPVADASAVGVADALGPGAAKVFGALDGGLGLGGDGLVEVGVAQGGGAAGELVHWCFPFRWSPWMIPLGGCGGVRVSASGHLPRTGGRL